MLLILYPIIIDNILELRLIRIIPILDIPTLTFVVHVCDLIHVLQSNRIALRTHGNRVIGVVLKLLKLSQAIVAMVNVDGHAKPSCTR